jgi:hypothetical protein
MALSLFVASSGLAAEPPVPRSDSPRPELAAAMPDDTAVAEAKESGAAIDESAGDASQQRERGGPVPPARFDDLGSRPAPDALPQLIARHSSGRHSSDRNSSDLDRLSNKIHRVLNHYYRRPVNTREQNCWEVMHWIIAYGVKSRVFRDGPTGPAVNSIGWLCYGGKCAGQPLVHLDQGRVAAAKGPRVQGHHGQFLAILAQSKVMKDYSMQVGGRAFTVADLIETEKLGCQTGMELTFKLIALAHYLDLSETWPNSEGEEWSVSRLVQEELKAPIRGAACGGTHRLMGLSYAVHERQKRGESLDGQFRRADVYIRDFHRYTFSLQNADGSFSTDWFKGPGDKEDLERRLQTTGHILEWLAYSVPAEMLEEPRLVRAADYLATMLSTHSDKQWSIGTLGHGLHALALFDERASKARKAAPAPLARRRGRTASFEEEIEAGRPSHDPSPPSVGP